MKSNNLTNSLFAVLFLASPLVGADQKYPAADFQPEVIYQDADYISKNSQSTERHSSSSESNAADSKYPAANFQPQVVYADPDYKHSSSVVVDAKLVENESGVNKNKDQDQAVDTNKAETSKNEKSSSSYLIGILGLAAIGVFFFRKQTQSASKKAERDEPVQFQGAQKLTGVARYLNKTSGTGVSRYVEKQVKSAVAVTGVAKYMAKQVTATKASAIQAATGVEKYMRNRG